MTLKEDLEQFIGTEKYHRLTLMPLLATDGVDYFIKATKANWLFEDMSLRYMDLRFEEPFIAVTVNGDGENVEVKYTDGNNKVLAVDTCYTPDIVGKYSFFITNDVCMLPSEY